MEPRKPSTFRIRGLEISGIDPLRLKFTSDDLARKVCRVENGACGYLTTTVVKGALETTCERIHCGFDSDRFVKGLVGLLETLRPAADAPDEFEAGPDFSYCADFDIDDPQW